MFKYHISCWFAVVERLSTELQRLRNYREKLQNETESLLWNLTAPKVQVERFSGTAFEIAEFLRSSFVQLGNETCPVCGQAIHVEDSERNLPRRIHSLDQEIVNVNSQIAAEMDRINRPERSLISLEHEITSKSHSFEEIHIEITASDAELQQIRLQSRLSEEHTSAEETVGRSEKNREAAVEVPVLLSSTWIG
jgi:chromosome segregation ATPase